jgi:hypothetical protein
MVVEMIAEFQRALRNPVGWWREGSLWLRNVLHLPTHLDHLGLQLGHLHSLVLKIGSLCFILILKLRNVVDGCHSLVQKLHVTSDVRHTSRKSFPFAGLVVLAGWQASPQLFKAVLHLAPPFSFCKLVSYTQLGRSTVWSCAIRRVRIAPQVVYLLVLQAVVVSLGEFYRC